MVEDESDEAVHDAGYPWRDWHGRCQGYLTDEEIGYYASNELYKVGANVKRKYSTAEYNNLDIYQVNSTYYQRLEMTIVNSS